MNFQLAKEEYAEALARGKKELRELVILRKELHPAVLDEILDEDQAYTVQELGLAEIPVERIIGVKSAGRVSAFTPTFSPLLAPDSEFGLKWINLCKDHLGDEGIRDPIMCFEYLGNFYVQEGNKRVSVLRHFGAARIPSQIKRVVPPMSGDPRIKAYYEFMEFYKTARIYCCQYRRPGDYAKLLAAVDKAKGEPWSEEERRVFRSYFQYFLDAFQAVKVKDKDILPEEALLLWLQVHDYKDLGSMTSAELRKSLSALWPDVVAGTQQSQLKTETTPVTDSKAGIISRIMCM